MISVLVQLQLTYEPSFMLDAKRGLCVGFPCSFTHTGLAMFCGSHTRQASRQRAKQAAFCGNNVRDPRTEFDYNFPIFKTLPSILHLSLTCTVTLCKRRYFTCVCSNPNTHLTVVVFHTSANKSKSVSFKQATFLPFMPVYCRCYYS